jgi:hypothetical protein
MGAMREVVFGGIADFSVVALKSRYVQQRQAG